MMPGINCSMINIGGESTLSVDKLEQLIIGLRKIVFDYDKSTGLYNKSKLRTKFFFQRLVYLSEKGKQDGVSYEELEKTVEKLVGEGQKLKNYNFEEKSFSLESKEIKEEKEENEAGNVQTEYNIKGKSSESVAIIINTKKYQEINCINFYETDEINLSLVVDSNTAYLCGFNIYDKQQEMRQFIIYGENDRGENKIVLDNIIESLEICNDNAKIKRIPISIDYGTQFLSSDWSSSVITERDLFFIANMHLIDYYSSRNYFYSFVGLVFECARNPALQNVVIRQLKIGGGIQLSDLVCFGKNLTSSDYNGLVEHLNACGSVAAYQYFNDDKIIEPKDFYTILCKLYAFKEQSIISVDRQNFCIEMFLIIKSTKLQSSVNICDVFQDFYGKQYCFDGVGNYLVECFRKEWSNEPLSDIIGNVQVERRNLIKVLGDLGNKACKEYLDRKDKYFEECVVENSYREQQGELLGFSKYYQSEYYKNDKIFCKILLDKRERFCEIFPDLRDCPFIDEFSDALVNYCVSKYPWLDNKIEINPVELRNFILSEIGLVEARKMMDIKLNIILNRQNVSKLREYSLTNGKIEVKTDTVKKENNDEQLSFCLE